MSSNQPYIESPPAPNPRRWAALAALALVQFIIYADATIVNVALPSIQDDLHFSSNSLVWVVNCYLIAAGGLLLLGGRLGDHFGHRRVFLCGAAGFTIASLIAGCAQNSAMLLIGRVLQGVSEGLAAPAGLAIVALLFTDQEELGRAFGIWSGLAGLGAASGVLLSGLFTDLLTWRLVFFINVPLALIALIAVPKLVGESRAGDGEHRLDWPGAVLITGGLFAVLYGILGAADDGWLTVRVLVPLVIGIVAVAGFFAVEGRTNDPLVPLAFIANRVRATAYAVVIVLGGATAALFFMVVLYMQDILDYSPLQSGLAWLPYTVAFLAGIMFCMRVSQQWGSRWTILTGLVIVGAGMVVLCFIGEQGSFATHVLPATVLIGFGIGFANPAVQQAAMTSVSERDAGLGSGLFTTLLQLSGAIGLSVLMSVALATTNHKTDGGASVAAATVSGYHAAFAIAVVALACAAVATVALLPRKAAPVDEQPAVTEPTVSGGM
ncbi:major facilitator superfamily transporter [Nocardia nova SH22a]|uniref:Major facilitator superfamily transporter n=1 Tax=Nocardia nova SH22a TaxID=1415166 RepID=W5TH43_9NOCA|nr:MFS transporter [Nocardia nova]AHH18690.1 major facilitator superfamily transporter [Nocardia nova SH22a]